MGSCFPLPSHCTRPQDPHGPTLGLDVLLLGVAGMTPVLVLQVLLLVGMLPFKRQGRTALLGGVCGGRGRRVPGVPLRGGVPGHTPPGAPGSFAQAVADAAAAFEMEIPSLGEWGYGEEGTRRITQAVLSTLGGESEALWSRFGDTNRWC